MSSHAFVEHVSLQLNRSALGSAAVAKPCFLALTVRSELGYWPVCRETGWDIDCIVPVPDGSRPAAIQMSAELGLPYREGLVKNRYVGRTFIMPDQVRHQGGDPGTKGEAQRERPGSAPLAGVLGHCRV